MTTKHTLRKVDHFKNQLSHCDTNRRYISTLRALKRWMIKFSDSMSAEEREQGEYATEYLALFFAGCGHSFFSRICMSIEDYDNGNKPF